MEESKTIPILVSIFFAGVFFRSILFSPKEFLLFGGIGFLIGLVNRKKFKLTKWFLVISTLLFVLGFAITSRAFLNKPDSVLADRVNQQITLDGVIISEPVISGQKVKYVIKVSKIVSENGDLLDVKDKVVFSANQYPQYFYGNFVTVKGILQEPEAFLNEDGRNFDYKIFLLKDKIHFKVSNPVLNLQNNNQLKGLKFYLLLLKQKVIKLTQALLPEPYAGLLAGIVFGYVGGLSDELQEQIRIAGLSHITVLSGFNITIVANTGIKLFSFLPRNIALTFSSAFIWMFVIFAGSNASIVRAGIMAQSAIIAKLFYRKYEPLRILFVSGFIMVLLNPLMLFFDRSFELSFLATLGLLLFAEPLTIKLKRLGPLAQTTAQTLSAQLGVLPLLMFGFGRLSVVSLFVNVLVLWSVEPVMFLGFFAVTSLAWFKPLASLLSLIVLATLKFILGVAQFAAGLPFAELKIKNMPFAVFFVLSLLYAIFVLRNLPQPSPPSSALLRKGKKERESVVQR